MQAFHNDPAVKAKYVNRLTAHRAAETLIRGTGWEAQTLLQLLSECK